MKSKGKAGGGVTARLWREVGTLPGNGNDGFLRFGSGLAKAGLAGREIERILKEEGRYAHTPKDRLRNIPHVIRSLRRRQGMAVV
jgi:hypothetical protein